MLTSSPGKYSGQDNGWALSLIEPVIIDFDKSIMKYPNIKRFPGGASNDLVPNLQHPDDPVPLLKDQPRTAYRRRRRLIENETAGLARQIVGGHGRPPFPIRPARTSSRKGTID